MPISGRSATGQHCVLADLRETSEAQEDDAVDQREGPGGQRARDQRQPIGEHRPQLGSRNGLEPATHRAHSVDRRDGVPYTGGEEDAVDAPVEREHTATPSAVVAVAARADIVR